MIMQFLQFEGIDKMKSASCLLNDRVRVNETLFESLKNFSLNDYFFSTKIYIFSTQI